jgi:hypothetical protein
MHGMSDASFGERVLLTVELFVLGLSRYSRKEVQQFSRSKDMRSFAAGRPLLDYQSLRSHSAGCVSAGLISSDFACCAFVCIRAQGSIKWVGAPQNRWHS